MALPDPVPPFVLHPPVGDEAPVLFDSPHSGFDWPADFQPAAPRDAILTTCDRFVDELWADVPAAGGTLLAATFPRAYVDTNRAETDLDPAVLATPWPQPLSPSDYSRRGMGLIRRLALPGVPMETAPLSVAAVEHRLTAYYRPYRGALVAALDGLHRRHGIVYHLNCHSMKSRGTAMNIDADQLRPDIVVSDRLGTTAAPLATQWLAARFRAAGFSVKINEPYRGGDLIAATGAPTRGGHSIQIEINRSLYLDESTYARRPDFAAVRARLGTVAIDFCAFARSHTTQPLAAAPIA